MNWDNLKRYIKRWQWWVGVPVAFAYLIAATVLCAICGLIYGLNSLAVKVDPSRAKVSRFDRLSEWARGEE